jgi:hypothetical protein
MPGEGKRNHKCGALPLPMGEVKTPHPDLLHCAAVVVMPALVAGIHVFLNRTQR